jgi:AraC-like DNA-binding protein
VVGATSEQSHPAPGAAGNITRLAYARAKQAAIELKPLLKKARLKEEQIADAQIRLGVRNQIAFLNLVASALADDLLGFHLGQSPDLREMGLLYYVAASSELLGNALRRAARYAKVVNEGVAMEYIEGDDVAIRLRYVGVARDSDRHQIECLITAVVRLCRQLTGQTLLPIRVQFAHLRLGDPSEMDTFLGCPAQFGAPADEVAFPKSVMGLPVIGADPYLNKLLIAHFDEVLQQRPSIASASLRSKMEEVIAPLLPHGQARIGEVSRKLGMSQRTLARRLALEGATFSGVTEGLRSSLAERYLRDQNLSISQVAWLLGYQEVSAFTHACKRWTGKTPRDVRANQNLSASSG